MTSKNKDYDTPSDAEKQVGEYFQKWAFLVTDQGYSFDILYFDNFLESGRLLSSEGTTMQCWSDWEYKRARIAVNLKVINEELGLRLEWIVVHELVHILQGDGEYEANSIRERVCSEITSAILRASVKFIDAK